MDMECKSLKELLSAIAADLNHRRKTKREASHDLAHGFCRLLDEKHGVRILAEPKSRIANYFCAEIAGKPVWISPFASHDRFWEKPSNGLMGKASGPDCIWGTVHFELTSSDHRSFWTEGMDFKTKVLKEHDKVNWSNLGPAIEKGFAKEFSDIREFVEIVESAIRKRPGKLLLKKSKDRDI